MSCRLNRLARYVVLAALLFVGSTPHTPRQSDGAVALLPEVRLRKLHLVRPDLIPYPLFYEVVC